MKTRHRCRRFLSTLRRTSKPSIVRIMALCLILTAPILPAFHRAGDGQSVVYVVDRSMSIEEVDRRAAEAFVARAQALQGEADLGVVVFDHEAQLVVPVSSSGETPTSFTLPATSTDEPQERGSDLAGAIRLAAAALPESGERRIVVLSDGRGTRGEALEEVERAHQEGVIVDTVPAANESNQRAAVSAVELEHDRVAEGEPITAIAHVRGVPGERLHVIWSRDGISQRTESVPLDERGQGVSQLVDPAPSRGHHVYEAHVSTRVGDRAGQTLDLGQALAVVTGKPRVMVLSSTGERPSLLLDALDNADADVVIRSLESGQPTEAELTETDLVILADVAIARRGEVTLLAGLTEEGQQTLLDYVSERGGGLIALGGIFGFGPEYSGETIARLLPVEIENLGEIENPSVAMAIMLDRSGSMTAMVGGHTKLQLAIEAALAAAGSLRTHDRAAIGAVDEQTMWAQPLGSLADLMRRREHIRSIGAGGGGIFVYTALTDAYATLQSAPEPIRHVVLFSDTADSEQQTENCIYPPCAAGGRTAIDLARTARASGISTSVVGIGNPYDHDVPFLRNLAAAGGGRFYVTSQATDLRRIFVSETRAATRSSLREERVIPELASSHQILTGLDLAAMPAIEGYVQTGRRATADTALVTPDGRPVLASWRYGIGNVVAWTTDGGQRWTQEWASWPDTGQMMRQMVRFAMRRHGGHGVQATMELRGQAAEVEVEVPESGRATSRPTSVELVALSSDGERTEVQTTLERVAPGRWVARGVTSGQPFGIARVLDEEGRVVAEVVGAQDAVTELTGEGSDERSLRELASVGGGVYAPDPAATLRSGGPRGQRPVATWPFALLLAALLVCLDLWLRRLGQGKNVAIEQLQPRTERAPVKQSEAPPVAQPRPREQVVPAQ